MNQRKDLINKNIDTPRTVAIKNPPKTTEKIGLVAKKSLFRNRPSKAAPAQKNPIKIATKRMIDRIIRLIIFNIGKLYPISQ